MDHTLLLLLWVSSVRVLIMLIPYCLARLQRVEQALARVVTQQSSLSPLTSTELLKQLHWFPSNDESDLSLLL